MGYYMQDEDYLERNYNESSQKKDICSNKIIPDFEKINW